MRAKDDAGCRVGPFRLPSPVREEHSAARGGGFRVATRGLADRSSSAATERAAAARDLGRGPRRPRRRGSAALSIGGPCSGPERSAGSAMRWRGRGRSASATARGIAQDGSHRSRPPGPRPPRAAPQRAPAARGRHRRRRGRRSPTTVRQRATRWRRRGPRGLPRRPDCRGAREGTAGTTEWMLRARGTTSLSAPTARSLGGREGLVGAHGPPGSLNGPERVPEQPSSEVEGSRRAAPTLGRSGKRSSARGNSGVVPSGLKGGRTATDTGVGSIVREGEGGRAARRQERRPRRPKRPQGRRARRRLHMQQARAVGAPRQPDRCGAGAGGIGERLLLARAVASSSARTPRGPSSLGARWRRARPRRRAWPSHPGLGERRPRARDL